MGKNMRFQEIKNRTIIGSRYSTYGHISKGNKISIPKRYLHFFLLVNSTSVKRGEIYFHKQLSQLRFFKKGPKDERELALSAMIMQQALVQKKGTVLVKKQTNGLIK